MYDVYVMTMKISNRLERTEKRMVRWLCGIQLRHRVPSKELRERMGIELVSDVIKRNSLRWLGHLLRKYDCDWMKFAFRLRWRVQGDEEGRG